MSEELKPCAHCASDAVNYSPTDDHESQMIECRFCGSAIQDHFATKPELISMWNLRNPITLGQSRQVLAEAGLVAVPTEPTSAMLQAGEDCFVPSYTGTPIATPDDIYKAMIKAAQEQSSDG